MFFKKQRGNFKQVIIIRSDLKLPKGKSAAQAAHASVEATLRSNSRIVSAWRNQGMKKIVLKVANEKELLQIQNEAKRAGLVAALITDAGKTVVAPGTKTVVALGPDNEEKIDTVTAGLKMY